MQIFSSFWQCQKIEKKIGPEKSAPWCPFDRRGDRGGAKKRRKFSDRYFVPTPLPKAEQQLEEGFREGENILVFFRTL